jgi:hypothetical protein
MVRICHCVVGLFSISERCCREATFRILLVSDRAAWVKVKNPDAVARQRERAARWNR